MNRFENELKNNFDAIIDAMSDDLLIADGKGRVMIVSPSFEKFYGLSKEEAVGRTVYELEKEGYFKPSIIAKVLEKKEKITMPQKDKKGRDIIVTATPIFNEDGTIKFVISFSRDITEMVELQKRYSRLQDKVARYSAEINELRNGSGNGEGIIAKSIQMERIMTTIDRVAGFDANILLLGPSGVGKTMLAKVIHQKSQRAGKPFVDINCAAIPENLLESELFGYEKGSFTGANAQGKTGLMELANGGTLLLDEISEIPLTLQAKLLKAIQDKVITKVGGTKPIKVDFRLIAASNRQLEQYSDEGKFRKDLYYRLNVVNIKIPPLSERTEDIIPLVDFFCNKINAKYGLEKSFVPKAMDLLMEYSWPGNIRELSNVVERVMVTCDGDDIQVTDLPEEITKRTRNKSVYELSEIESLSSALEELEEHLIKLAYEKYGTTVGVAECLKISQPTAFRKVNKYILK